MAHFSLFQVLLFCDSQSHCGFQTIYDVLSIIDNTNIIDELKRSLILDAFRQAGFFDIEYIKAMPESVRQSIIAAYQKKLDDNNKA